jgi:hypothetical protein
MARPRTTENPHEKNSLVSILMLGLLVSAHPALANHLTSATATVSCTGYTLTVDADLLSVGTAYTIDYTFTLTPASGPAIPVPGTISFTAELSTFTKTISMNWTNGPLASSFTVTGTAVLTSNPSVIVPITFNGSSAAALTCGLDGRMTGGGSVFETDGTRVTHGFELHCDTEDVPNRLEINWLADVSTWRLWFRHSVPRTPPSMPATQPTFSTPTWALAQDVSTASLVPRRAGTFTDAGEPGKNDMATIAITDSLGKVVLTVSGKLDSGNQQAHVDNK